MSITVGGRRLDGVVDHCVDLRVETVGAYFVRVPGAAGYDYFYWAAPAAHGLDAREWHDLQPRQAPDNYEI